MSHKYGVTAGLVVAAFAAGIYVGGSMTAEAQKGPVRVLEVRKYMTKEGRLDALVKRMREHEAGFFAKAGMTNVFHAVAADAPASANTYLYVLGHPTREAAKESWAAFRADKEWPVHRAESEKDGVILDKTEVAFYNLTDFSTVK